MMHQLTQDELDCLRSLKQAADELGIGVLAVGASARQLVFDAPHGIKFHRSTKDWDFGVRVPDWSTFIRLRSRLIEQPDSFTAGQFGHQLIHQRTGTPVDLVPFGGVENDGRISWPDNSFEMNVFGFSDAYEKATIIVLAPDLSLRAATTPLHVALKLFAFADRKNEMDRDLRDLWHIISNYVVKGREADLCDEPLSLLIDEDFDWGEFSPPLLAGFDMRRACNPATIERLAPIVRGLSDPYSADINPLLTRYSSAEQEEKERRRVSSCFAWMRKALQLSASR